MKRILLFAILLLTFEVIYPQVKVSGIVTDAFTREPIPGAIVYVYNGNTLCSYSSTDSNGAYSILLNGEYTHLTFYQMGYSSSKVTFSSSPTQNIVKNISLVEATQMLKSITVKPVAVKVDADTVTYDVSAFAKREDQTLAQILTRLPNVKVASNGGVTINGQKINKLYIEDMDLLGGRYGIAVRNLRREDIAAVTIYHNHQPIKALKGIEISNQHALNIKLKENAKSRWLIAAGFGAGLSEKNELLRQAKLNAMNFSPDRQTVITAKSDNTGTDIISETKLQNIKPGGYKLEDLQHTIKDLFRVPAVILPIEQSLYFDNNSNAITLNNLHKSDNGKTLRENIIIASDKTTNNTSAIQVVVPENSGTIVIADSSCLMRNNLNIGGELTYSVNKETHYLENIFSFNVCIDDATADIKGSANNYSQIYDLPKLLLENRLKSVKNKKGRKATQFNADIAFSRQKEEMRVIHKEPSQTFGTGCLTEEIQSSKLSGNFYTRFSRRQGRVSFALTSGLQTLYNNFKSEFKPYTDSTANNLNLISFQPYLTPSLSVQTKKLDLNIQIPVSLRYDNIHNKNNIYCLYNPALNIKYKLGVDFSINAYARGGNNVGGVESMVKNYIYSGYRDFIAYNTLEKNSSYSMGGVLAYNNLSKFLSAGLSANTSILKSNLMPWETILEDYTFMQYENGDNKRTQKSLSLNTRKIFGINKLSVEANAILTEEVAEQYLQGLLYKYNTTGVSAGLNLEFTPISSLSFTYRGNYAHNKFKGGPTSSHINTLTNNASITAYPTKKLQLKGDIYHFTQEIATSHDISLAFLNFSAEYKLNNRVRIWLKLKNITNEKHYQYTYYTSVSTINRKVALRGAEFLAGAALDF